MSTAWPGYVLVTPARNEAAHIGRTIDSVVAQTVRPLRWVIVSDGSSDDTEAIVRERSAGHDWIELLSRPARADRQFAGKVQAFEAGRLRMHGLPYEVIGNLDADISFDPDYLERLLGHFARLPRLGVAGTPYIEDFSQPGRHAYDHPHANLNHVSGACQLFRRTCFEEIGGYPALPGGAVDTVACLAARMKGWQTRTFTDQVCRHHRPVGTAEQGTLHARARRGMRAYAIGGDPLWELLRGLRDLRRRPWLLLGLSHLAGYGWAWWRGAPLAVPEAVAAFHRQEQRERLRQVWKDWRGETAIDQVTVTRKGRAQQVPAARVDGHAVLCRGRWLRHAEPQDEVWLEGQAAYSSDAFLRALQASPLAPDLLSFHLGGDQPAPHWPHRLQPDNLACIDVRDQQAWWEGLPQQTRKNVRRAERRGLRVHEAPYDESFARGIQRIYDETPVRQGRPFWHHGKDLVTVMRENASYADRAWFLGAWVGDEMVGFLKAVRVGRCARIMQILALVREQDRRPTMALIAHMVEVAHRSGLDTLVYDRMVYGHKAGSSMTEFKRRMGFAAVPQRRCTVALSARGRLALALGLHRPPADRLPEPVLSRLLALRRWWLERRQGPAPHAAKDGPQAQPACPS